MTDQYALIYQAMLVGSSTVFLIESAAEVSTGQIPTPLLIRMHIKLIQSYKH